MADRKITYNPKILLWQIKTVKKNLPWAGIQPKMACNPGQCVFLESLFKSPLVSNGSLDKPG